MGLSPTGSVGKLESTEKFLDNKIKIYYVANKMIRSFSELLLLIFYHLIDWLKITQCNLIYKYWHKYQWELKEICFFARNTQNILDITSLFFNIKDEKFGTDAKKS